MGLFKENSSQKVVYSTTIDFKYDNEKYKKLTKSGEFFFRNNNYVNEKPTTYYEIQTFVTDVINNELQNICQNYFDMPIIKIKVQQTYEGSIELIFTVVLKIIQGISIVKDVYDIVELINDISEKHVAKRLSEKYGDYFKVSTNTRIPKRRNDYYIEELMHKRGVTVFTAQDSNKRDAFFYYLLVSNIILLIIIGLLVYKAVIAMY